MDELTDIFTQTVYTKYCYSVRCAQCVN